MLRRLVLATFFALCLSGIIFGQRGDRECARCDREDSKVASVEPTFSEKQEATRAVLNARERYFDALKNGTEAQRKEAFQKLKDAADDALGSHGVPSIDVKSSFPVSVEVEKSKDYDKRLGGSSDKGGRQPDGGGKQRDRDKANGDRRVGDNKP